MTSLPNLALWELKALCKARGLPIGNRDTKADFQKALVAYETASLTNASSDSKDAPAGEEDEEDQRVNDEGERDSEEDDALNFPSRPSSVGSGRSIVSHSQTGKGQDKPEAKLNLLAIEERQLKLEEKRLAQEERRVKMGLGRKANGGSIKEGSLWSSPDPKLSKGIVPQFVEEDDIDKWFPYFERAFKMRKVGRLHWGSLIWDLLLVGEGQAPNPR